MSYRNYAPANGYIIDGSGNGDFVSFTAAGTALSGVTGKTFFVKPGTYAESFTALVGNNYVAFNTDGQTANVIINGTVTCSAAGTYGFSNISFQTNSANSFIVSGSVATVVNCFDCNFNCTNNTGISISSSSASALVTLKNCTGDLGTTGIGYWAVTGSGAMNIFDSRFTNSGGSTTASTSSSVVNITNSTFLAPISNSSTAGGTFTKCQFSTIAQNTLAITIGGTGTNVMSFCDVVSGTAAGVSVSVSCTLVLHLTRFDSTNTNPVTGAGTVLISGVTFTNSGVGINTTTITSQNFNKTGTFTPGIAFGGATTGITYSTQEGHYTQIGNVVYFSAFVNLSSKGSASGQATLTGFPVATATLTGGLLPITFSNCTLTANYSNAALQFNQSNTTANIIQYQGAVSEGFAGITAAICSNTSAFGVQGFYFTS